NKTKQKAGTGILALPYACKQGGLLLFISGMFLIPLWNVYCMKLLCDSLEYLVRLADSPSDNIDVELTPKTLTRQKRLPPPIGTSSFSKLGWYALGKSGLWTIDLMMLMLLLFICIAFEVAILTFAESTPFTTGRKMIDAIILGFLLVPLCIVDDMSALSKLSRLGLIILGFSMLVIAFYGISGYENNNSNDIDVGISKWFGCVVFSFGVVPLTFNYRESMAEPEKLQKVAMISMSLVGVCYVIIGVSFLYIFPNIEQDLLSEIPSHGMLATTTRLAMIITTMAGTPLLIVPCAEIIEGKIMNNEDGQTKSKKLMIIIRTCILLCTVLIASELPSFVSILAFAGSFAVSMVSFVVPPGLHWLLLRQGYYDGPGGLDFPIWSRICDLSMLLIGSLTTIITTWFAGHK
ncbi:hypothetical protein FRACYDRAFT_184439, partial [Fragilariopsis cylindrus CCMP1102]